MAGRKKPRLAEKQEVPAPVSVRFDQLFGHGAHLYRLRRAIGREILPQSLIFHGSAGIGKATLARMVAAALECEEGGDGACGHCLACRKVSRGIHPDVREIALERSASSGKMSTQIVVSQVQKMLHTLELPPYEGRRLVFIIDPAEALNRNAQNAMLKALEEPPSYAQFLLVASSPSALLPTVRSRCSQLAFHPLKTEEMAAFAEARGVVMDNREEALSLAAGSPARLLQSGGSLETRKRDAILDSLQQGLLPESYPYLAPKLEGLATESPREVLTLATALVLDALRVSNGLSPIAHRDVRERLAGIVENRGPEGLQVIASRLTEAPAHLVRNVNPRLLWERVFLVP